MNACIYCEHCGFDPAVWYSALTGGDDASFYCMKNHFTYTDVEGMCEGQLYEIAQKCGDFELKKEIKEKQNDHQ